MFEFAIVDNERIESLNQEVIGDELKEVYI